MLIKMQQCNSGIIVAFFGLLTVIYRCPFDANFVLWQIQFPALRLRQFWFLSPAFLKILLLDNAFHQVDSEALVQADNFFAEIMFTVSAFS